MGAYDRDSAGMVAFKKGLKIVNDSYTFFECCSFNSIREYRKIGKILPKCILFLQNMILNRVIQSISYKITNFTLFLKNFVVSGSCLHEFEICYGCVFKKEFTASIKKNGEMTQIYPKNYF